MNTSLLMNNHEGYTKGTPVNPPIISIIFRIHITN
jgi:hypothetical protein